jgi:alkylated DNA nucleotide flippase Atl1
MTRSERAMQVWQILVAAAHNRQSLTYGQVADYLGFEGAGVLAQILGQIMNHCKEQGLPPLTCLVVNQDTGLPGSGLSTVEDLPRDREAVYRQNWFSLPPAQIKDFEAQA